MTLYDDTIAAVQTLAARAGSIDNALFCEQRPLTSLEARFAGLDDLASELRAIEDDAIRALGRLVDAEEGYETALESIDQAGPADDHLVAGGDARAFVGGAAAAAIAHPNRRFSRTGKTSNRLQTLSRCG